MTPLPPSGQPSYYTLQQCYSGVVYGNTYQHYYAVQTCYPSPEKQNLRHDKDVTKTRTVASNNNNNYNIQPNVHNRESLLSIIQAMMLIDDVSRLQ
jgi:hypothetical protein